MPSHFGDETRGSIEDEPIEHRRVDLLGRNSAACNAVRTSLERGFTVWIFRARRTRKRRPLPARRHAVRSFRRQSAQLSLEECRNTATNTASQIASSSQ